MREKAVVSETETDAATCCYRSVVHRAPVRENYDVLISGAGIAGMAAAVSFARSGFKVLAVDACPLPPYTSTEEEFSGCWAAGQRSTGASRTVALMGDTVKFLEDLGVDFSNDFGDLAVIRGLKLYEAGLHESSCAVRRLAVFSPHKDGSFGYHVSNAALHRSLVRVASGLHDLITIVAPAEVVHIRCQTEQVLAELSCGRYVRSRLLVAADGRNSGTRERVGIRTRKISCGQGVLTFRVRHTVLHHGIVSEIYESGGPFTLVPAGSSPYESSVVWVDELHSIRKLMTLPDAEFMRVLRRRSRLVYGDMDVLTPPVSAPESMLMVAERFTAPRCVLMAEAAHVVPPSGAQGLNISLRDIQVFQEMLASCKSDVDIGALSLLNKYHRSRSRDILPLMAAIGLLNHSTRSGDPVAGLLRCCGAGIAVRYYRRMYGY